MRRRQYQEKKAGSANPAIERAAIDWIVVTANTIGIFVVLLAASSASYAPRQATVGSENYVVSASTY